MKPAVEEGGPAGFAGSTILARTLRSVGLAYVFGVAGIPITASAIAMQSEGLKYVGMRNEQAASYAAGAVGFLTRRPGVCLTVSGPGMLNAIPGVANASVNCWPVLLIAGASDSTTRAMGAFQDYEGTLDAVRPWVKFAARIEHVEQIAYMVEKAVRECMYGRAGASYLEIPSNVLKARTGIVVRMAEVPDPPQTCAANDDVERAVALLRGARSGLIVVGKGAAYDRAEHETRELMDLTQIPFLPTPMGKGVVPDDHWLCASAARSVALANADVILLLGARLNWMMHYGQPPRLRPDVKIIQVDIQPEELHNNVRAHVALCGSIRAIVGQINTSIRKTPFVSALRGETNWIKMLSEAKQPNVAAMERACLVDSTPLSYFRVMGEIKNAMPHDAIIVSEGANTMDISRAKIGHIYPRHRLDAGAGGTMGVGPGFAIAAAAIHPNKKVIAIEGDSAFGFSLAEVETAARYRLPITFVVVNNNGIYGGLDHLPEPPPPTSFIPNARYDLLADAFGGKGYYVETADELRTALREAINARVPTVVNVMIDPYAKNMKQSWHAAEQMASSVPATAYASDAEAAAPAAAPRTTFANLLLPAHFSRPALSVPSSPFPSLTYANLHLQVNRLSKLMTSSSSSSSTSPGMLTCARCGDVISMAMINSVELVVVFLATTLARATAAPLNPAYSSEEFKFYMSDAQSKALVVRRGEGEHARKAAMELGIELWEASVNKQGEVSLQCISASPRPANPTPTNAVQTQPVGSDVALFLHTSGTTSRPKGVPLTHANLMANLRNISSHYSLTPKDTTLVVMPLFHVHGLIGALLSTLYSGGHAVIPPRFSASSFWSEIDTFKATWYSAVPTIHQVLLARAASDMPQRWKGRLRFIRSCSSALAPSTLTQMESTFGSPVVQAYAMTEASHQMTSEALPPALHKKGSVGHGTGVKVAILDESGNEERRGTIAEVCIRGPNVMTGYRNNPDANKSNFTKNGWFRTGDQGYMDEDGDVFLTGRLKELINRGGEKISPLEVDSVLLEEPAVSEAVCFGVPDTKYGEEIHAAVVLKQPVEKKNHQATAQEIQKFCKERLTDFKIPKVIYITDALPRTATGKIQRRFVAAHFASKADSSQEGNNTTIRSRL
mmetsp:Transcript_48439/g.80516  ORF Transcript_48439/g.80516 Transcript_48439/m.80516 type:complete len:1128 (+) Transcript_48439:91-3474(+)|eukprot:CAMPEP_0184342316 /NCGR_PEP_ID=MMETSP1089-20130417/10926_1 /TAXON_ID=38269 ORGANISM="Gloeochaete wittrockiana, Strain SAG46.84" /NCGR_SAMPLE_ID=MMETSP1089 /ASSEMBLY_ACC=CAM_ASM_000445 /LENGTH=1127 /DNA_ID=CAMNT_0026671105 /DNA_START=41 /DNA_END=3424 /DNA_ORIENTATION=+